MRGRADFIDPNVCLAPESGGVSGRRCLKLLPRLLRRPLPFGVVFVIEDQLLVRRRAQPVSARDLGFQLPLAPARIAEGHQAVARPLAFGDGLQQVNVGGHGYPLVDDAGLRSVVVAGMEHEALPYRQLHRPAVMKPNSPLDVTKVDVVVFQEIGEGAIAEYLVDD